MFGPFAAVFEKGELAVPGYLELLHLTRPGGRVVIDRIENVLRGGDSARWVAALFQDRNWRPHLVGAVALLLEPSLDPQLLWGAIDQASWVTPQLVVTATFLDPAFQDHVRSRVAASSPAEYLIGATSHRGLSPKMLASLLAASVEFPDLAPWRAIVLEDEHIKRMLAEDAAWDSSDRIVASWSAAVRAAFLVRGRTLTVMAR